MNRLGPERQPHLPFPKGLIKSCSPFLQMLSCSAARATLHLLPQLLSKIVAYTVGKENLNNLPIMLVKEHFTQLRLLRIARTGSGSASHLNLISRWGLFLQDKPFVFSWARTLVSVLMYIKTSLMSMIEMALPFGAGHSIVHPWAKTPSPTPDISRHQRWVEPLLVGKMSLALRAGHCWRVEWVERKNHPLFAQNGSLGDDDVTQNRTGFVFPTLLPPSGKRSHQEDTWRQSSSISSYQGLMRRRSWRSNLRWWW